MKGQYFLLSGIILLTLFYIGFYLATSNTILTQSFHSDDMIYIAENLENEYSKVYNFGINESSINERLGNFTIFSRNSLSGNLINFSALWIHTINESDNLNVTVGNYLGSPVIVTLNVSGSAQNLSVTSNGINSTVFTSVSPKFNMTVIFNSQQKKLSMLRDKYNIYPYIELLRQSEIIKGGVLA